MRIENVSLPYPVLGISDDIIPTLEETGCSAPRINLEEEGDSIKISVELKLENSDILAYIKKESAEYAVEVTCPSTMFRECKTSPAPSFDFLIKKNLLNGKLDFESFVIAKKDIIGYKNEGLNPDYEGHIINLHKGDLLVAYKKSSYPLNLDLRNIRNIRSFMTVLKNPRENEHSVTYDLDGPKILIYLPEEMMVEYNKSSSDISENNKRKKILKASIYVQALTYALLHYKEYKDNESDSLWVNALTYRMREDDLREYCSDIFSGESSGDNSQNMNDLFKLAHIMLNQPYIDMLQQISANRNNMGQIIDD